MLQQHEFARIRRAGMRPYGRFDCVIRPRHDHRREGGGQAELGCEGRSAGAKRNDRSPADAFDRERNDVLRDEIEIEQHPGFAGRPIQRVNDKAVIGAVPERGGGLAPMRRGSGREVEFGMRKRMQLRRTARHGECEREEQPKYDAPAHA